MNKAILALVLLGVAAVAQAQFIYETDFVWQKDVIGGDGTYKNYVERGLDCGDVTIPDATNAPDRPCNCFTDLARKRDPPTLLNQGVDRPSGDVRETGIVPAAEFGNPAELEIAVSLDYGVFQPANPELNVNNPRTGSLIDKTGTVPLVPQLQGRDDVLTAGFHSGGYFQPRLEFFTKDGSQNDVSQASCRWSLDSTTPGFATANIDAGVTPNYDTGGNTYANCDANAGDSSSSILWVRKDVREALNQCGFATAAGEAAGDHGITQPGGAVVGDSTFTIYTGTFKVIQWIQGGALDGKEVAKKEEYPFTIKLAFPENIQVTSEVISVIGKAEYASTITHSIYESATDKEYVNVNALFGTTFPFAVSKTADYSTENTDYVYKLALAADSPACAHFVSLASDATTFNARCTEGGLGVTAFTAQTQENYRLGTPVLCDLNNNGVCDITDIFEVVNSGQFFKTEAEVKSFFDITDFSPAGSALIATRCTGVNYGGGATATVDGMACLQNMGLRLKPKGWCDLNANLAITVNAVCRDDAEGDDNAGSVVSLIDGTTMTQVDSVYTNVVPDAGNTALNPFLAHTTARLQQGPSNAALLTCSSTQYSEQQDPRHVLTFSLRSDDFCPRVVATADVTASMLVYPSELGAATWGARLTEQAGGVYDTIEEINAEIADTDNTYIDTGCFALYKSANTLAGYLSNPLCLQVPLMADGIQTQGESGIRAKQDSFVYGTTAYLETTLSVEAGVNVLASTIDELYVGHKRTDTTFFPAPTDVYQTTDMTDRVGSPSTDEQKWLKQLIVKPEGSPAEIASGLETWRDDIKNVAVTLSQSDVADRVKVSNELTVNSMIKGYDSANDIYGAGVAQTRQFFTSNPCVGRGATGTNEGFDALAACANLGVTYNGVSRVSVFLDDYTVYISDDAREAPEEIQFWAKIGITYQAANAQGDLRVPSTKTVQGLPSGYSDRARVMAAQAVSGGQASTSGSMSVGGSAGSTGSSSTIAGFSSTTVLAVAAVLGAVVVAAGASFFVVRKRNAAAKSAKRSSSSTELNDTLAVQA